jgi:hypothetical protein
LATEIFVAYIVFFIQRLLILVIVFVLVKANPVYKTSRGLSQGSKLAKRIFVLVNVY